MKIKEETEIKAEWDVESRVCQGELDIGSRVCLRSSKTAKYMYK